MAIISNAALLSLCSEIVEVRGDFVEIGTFRADTFKRLAMIGHAIGKHSHGFDSFQGMAPPTEKDFGQYSEGKLSVGGVEAFIGIMNKAGVPSDTYSLYPGWIPDCFEGFSGEVAFALVDVDQYQPTLDALKWVWPLMSPGSILVLDDYFRKRQGLAARAIEEWLEEQDPIEARVFNYLDTQLYVRKEWIEPRPLPSRRTLGEP